MIGLSLLHARVIAILALGSVTAVAVFDDGFGTIDSMIFTESMKPGELVVGAVYDDGFGTIDSMEVTEQMKTEDLGDAAAKSGDIVSKKGRKRPEGFTHVGTSSSLAEEVIREATHECSSFYNSLTPLPISFRDRPTVRGRVVLHESTEEGKCNVGQDRFLTSIVVHHDETVKIGGTGPCYYVGKFTQSDNRFKHGIIACYSGDRFLAGGVRCDIPGSCTDGDHGWHRVSATEQGPCSEFNEPFWQS